MFGLKVDDQLSLADSAAEFVSLAIDVKLYQRISSSQ
jgi:hypothetical protein